MRIDPVNKVSQLYQASSTKNISRVNAENRNDKLEISQLGKGYHIAKQALAQIPDIRDEKVNALKQQMQTGTYNIDAEEVVDHVVSRFNEMV